MKKLAMIGFLAGALSLAATPALARDYDRDHRDRDYRFEARHDRYERDYRDHHDGRRYDRDWRYEKHYHKHYKPHVSYYRCGYHPGYRGHHDHSHYYDSRTGEYLAIIGGTILLTELLHGHH